MKHILSIALIFGWYFAFQAPYDEKVKITSSVGPFVSENECKAELASFIEQAKGLGLEVRFTKCRYTQES